MTHQAVGLLAAFFQVGAMASGGGNQLVSVPTAAA